MKLANTPKVKQDIECPFCKTHLLEATYEDLDYGWLGTEASIKCPVCHNQIFNVLEKNEKNIPFVSGLNTGDYIPRNSTTISTGGAYQEIKMRGENE